MVDVLTEIQIARSSNVVAEYAANPDNAPDWYVNIKSVDWKTSKPLSIGSQIIFIAQFLGRRLKYTYEVIDYIPGRIITMRTSEGPFPMETTYVWKVADGDETHMSLRNRGMPSGFSKWFVPFMSFAMKRANNKDLRRLKEILETNPLPPDY